MTASTNIDKNPFRMRGWQWLATFLAAFVFLWLAGFGMFTHFVRSLSAYNPEQPTDAIIVLTGGAQRVNQGLDLLAQGQAKKLFISGVNGHVTLNEILDLWQRPIIKQDIDDCCIILDHKAKNTIQNARETKLWAEQQGIKTIRLVTSDYHMPRARLEFHATMPDVEILPWPVKSSSNQTEQVKFWQVCFGEYNKSIITLIKLYLLPVWAQKHMDLML
ncbi:MAG: YdcF family protein [Alphaproteobacteria bacterium]|nr:YdcF family protein [Alphaproteobacteria bacterium]